MRLSSAWQGGDGGGRGYLSTTIARVRRRGKCRAGPRFRLARAPSVGESSWCPAARAEVEGMYTVLLLAVLGGSNAVPACGRHSCRCPPACPVPGGNLAGGWGGPPCGP